MGDNGIAQVCLNGHVVTSKSNDLEIEQPFCSICGQPVINKCENCSTPVRGSFREPSVIDPPYWYPKTSYHKPAYCYQCGNAFSWTKRGKEAAYELIEFDDNLNATEKDDFKASINDLIIESPKTNLATVKFKTFVSKAGGELGKGLKEILIDLVSETVKKSIWGQ
jgi:hypothetical protein